MLYLIRHAHAEDAAEDAARALSGRGQEEAARLGRFLHSSGAVEAAEFWHSTLRRARETAEILRGELGSQGPIREMPGLAPEDPPEVFARRLVAEGEGIVVVGHNPHLTTLAALLVRGARATRPAVLFDKCAALALERCGTGKPGDWCVRWHIAPELLRPAGGR